MSSFRQFSGYSAPPGVKNNRHPQISSGIQSLDDLLGGGLFLGTITMIKQDRWTDYSSLILKYFMAQGVVCGHQGMIVSLDSDPNLFKDGLMGLSKSKSGQNNQCLNDSKNTINIRSKPMTRQLGELRNDQMKIAWRYQNLGSVSSDFYQNAPVDQLYCSSFDLTTKLDKDKDDLLKTVDESVLENQSQEGIFLNLLKLIKSELESLSSIKKDSPKSVLRIGIDSFGSSLWPDLKNLSNQEYDQNGNQTMVNLNYLFYSLAFIFFML